MRYILLLFVILISYGSLYPFRFSGDLISTADFFSWFFNYSYHTTKNDILANILLFVPYGFVAMMTLASSRKHLLYTLYLFVAGTVLAFLLQYLQFYLPARVPAATDAWYNSLGILAGMLTAHLIRQYSHSHLPQQHSMIMDWSQITIPLLLAMTWVAWRLFPFILELTTDSIVAAVSPLTQQPELNFRLIIRDCIGWLVFFILLTRPPFDTLPRFRVLKFAFYILGLEILIRNNNLTVNDLLSALAAFALYASLSTEQLQKGLIRGLALAIILTLVVPFSFAEPNNQFLWLPFVSFMKGNPWMNGELLLLKIYLYGSFIYLLRMTWVNWGGACFISIGLLFIISMLQIFIGSQNAELTDVLMAGLIAWALSQVEKAASDERAMAVK